MVFELDVPLLLMGKLAVAVLLLKALMEVLGRNLLLLRREVRPLLKLVRLGWQEGLRVREVGWEGTGHGRRRAMAPP